ncbi:MAG: hypothetical protein ROO76_10570 [Terriglobia bacterium]|nr:hypothetical protein [Terriglobia bacterium]
MDDICKNSNSKLLLTSSVATFLASSASSAGAMQEALRVMETYRWQCVLFGGLLRDLFILGSSHKTRDIDLVVSGGSSEEIAAAFGGDTVKRTRFGGITVRRGEWLLDIWPLQETWAFSKMGMPTPTFSDLPKTTFLNVEAVAVDLCCRGNEERLVYEHGFFEAVGRRTIEINFEPNPYPLLCVVRSFVTAGRLSFRIGPRLMRFVSKSTERVSTDELIAIQKSHYGHVRLTAESLHRFLRVISEAVDRDSSDSVELPISPMEKMALLQDVSVE